jgi:hypothetical protein
MSTKQNCKDNLKRNYKMEDSRTKTLQSNLSDLELTKKSDGRRVLIDAFSIASVSEQEEGCKVTLRVPVSTGANGNDVLEKDNLIEVGLSEELAAGLDGKTIDEFDAIGRANLQSDNIHPELAAFHKETFASYHDTGYENNEANAAVTAFENKYLDDLGSEAGGFTYNTDHGGVMPLPSNEAPLPAALQPAEATAKHGYFGTETATDRGFEENGIQPAKPMTFD